MPSPSTRSRTRTRSGARRIVVTHMPDFTGYTPTPATLASALTRPLFHLLMLALQKESLGSASHAPATKKTGVLALTAASLGLLAPK